MKRLVIGILAHVDSGKTTLSEALLFESGVLRKQGRVDHGDAFLDTDAQEKRRGITIYSKQAVLRTTDLELVLLDTPGHVDFSPEMERTLNVLDYAILVVSGTDGVQSHTDTLWQLLSQHKVPTVIFVNKMDLPGLGKAAILEDLTNRLSDSIVDFSDTPLPNTQLERIALCHEDLMEEYLSNGSFSDYCLSSAVSERMLFPCVFGSALKSDGITSLLNCMTRFTKSPCYPDSFGARVIKITRDPQGNRETWMKLTGGHLRVRSILSGTDKEGNEWNEKITGIRIYSGAKYQTADTLDAGMVCAVTGLTHTFSGMGLGYESPEEAPVLRPVLTYRVILPHDVDPQTALQRFRILEEEEPQLHIRWDEHLQELRLQLMGEIQLEILTEQLLRRFNMAVTFEQGSILYQETIETTVEGVGHFEPLRHYAEVHLMLEPGERGSGIVFDTICSENDLDRNWQRLILTNLAEKTHLGVLTGAPITDIRITLISGRAHVKHTEGGDFRQATYRAVRQGLMRAKSLLLEPWYRYNLEVPAANTGRAITDIQHMGGDFKQKMLNNQTTLLTGLAPVSEMQNYASVVAGYTRGIGKLNCSYAGYFPCHNQNEILKEVAYDAEHDTANTADSVFCSHGSGNIVNWQDVFQFMHLPELLPDILKEREAEPEEKTWIQRTREFEAHAATDQELMRIFERTYGPVKRDLPAGSAMRTRKNSLPSETKITRTTTRRIEGPEYVLVDGYNMIFAWDDLKQLARDSLELARDRLIDMLRNYQAVRQCELILVFDAYKVKNNPGSCEKEGSFHIVYTREAETADMYIERTTHQLGRDRRVRVATSDGLVQMIILGHGALRVPARIFRDEVDAVETSIRTFLEAQST